MPSSIDDYYNLVHSPWGRMFYDILWKQLDLEHKERLNILDFGSGFCVTSDHYAKKHNVVAVEPDLQMLERRFRNNSYHVIHGGLEALEQYDDGFFDVVICHNVLEYVSDQFGIFKQLSRILKKGGMLSLIKHNCTGRVFAYAVFGDDPRQALSLLEQGDGNCKTSFGIRHSYDNKTALQWAEKSDLKNTGIFGIRTFFALSSNDSIKFTDEWYDNMLELEMRVCNLAEYKNAAFFNHLTFVKKEGESLCRHG